ncbi:MAG: acyltransferase family protein [Acidobacteriota bacterium]
MAQTRYRPDIDGLRAVAVLSVIWYHAGFKAFAGGYVGVDVFFVISGFLITRLIRDQVDAGTFSFGTFYLRRARRLLPMLLVTLIATTVAAAVVLSPLLLKEFGASAVAAAVSASNFFFYRQAGYFDTSAILKPLLHTWSLSVEEQFYVFWPAILVFSLRRLPRIAAPLLVASIGALSLALSLTFASSPSAVFYLAPFRAWEFAIGALIVWLPERTPATNGLAEIGCVTGLTLIVSSALNIHPAAVDRLPLLAPSVGTALVLYCGTARYAGVLLRNRLAVGVGLISYSLYLVHWPLIVFARHARVDEFTRLQQWTLVVTAIATATVTYTFIESPLRRMNGPRVRFSNQGFVVRGVAALVLVLGVGLHMWATGGWLWRFPEVIRRQIRTDAIAYDKAYTWTGFRRFERPFGRVPGRKVWLVGDSQAADFFNVLAESGHLDRVDLTTLEVDMECQSLIAMEPEQFERLSREDRASCETASDELRRRTDLSAVDEVILAFNWDQRGIPVIGRAVATLHARGARQVFVVGRKSQGESGPDILLQHGMTPDIETYSASHKNPISWEANAAIRQLRENFVFIDLMSQVCPSSDSCRVLTDTSDIIFFDASHLTPPGARYLGARLSRAGTLPF